jgi:hypothetical protein
VSRSGHKLVVLMASIVVATAALIAAAPAGATFHEMKIRSIFRGPSQDQAFVELQMYAAGQNLIGGHHLIVWNQNASSTQDFVIPSDVPNGQNQSRILFGDTAATGSPDITINLLGDHLSANAAGGALCWEDIDCVSWGSFSGDGSLPTPAGTPISGNLSTSMASVRSISANCSTALEAADDTNQSNSDFGFAVGYSPRNNSLVPPEVLCPLPPSTTATTPIGTFSLKAAIKKCKKKFPKGPKRKKCIRKARQRAQP